MNYCIQDYVFHREINFYNVSIASLQYLSHQIVLGTILDFTLNSILNQEEIWQLTISVFYISVTLAFDLREYAQGDPLD